MKKNANATIVAIGLTALVSTGCDFNKRNEFIRFTTHPAEQVFRDHDSFRVYFTDEKNLLKELRYITMRKGDRVGCNDYGNDEKINKIDNIPSEIKSKFEYIDNLDDCVRVIKDLESGSQGYVNAVTFERIRPLANSKVIYAEIHLPRSQKIYPGSEVYDGKFQRKAEIDEVN